jgi:multidrug efflux pump subunit AcrA (membrane-fusion protein)
LAVLLAVAGRLHAHSAQGWVEPRLARLPGFSGLPAHKRWLRAKWALASGLALLALLPVPATVKAPLSIEPLERRVVSAPISGRIDAVLVEPGDVVKAGETVLVRMDTQTLQAERDAASAALQAALAQASTARMEGDADGERAAALRAEQAQAQLGLADNRIAEASVRAPIDGAVMGEDLRRRVGAQISRGDTLFEVAAPGAYRAEIMVADADVSRLAPGQSVRVSLDAFTLGGARATVQRIYPLAETNQKGAAFRVIAALEPTDQPLKPGMTGRARIETGWRPLGWQAIEPLVSLARRALWL